MEKKSDGASLSEYSLMGILDLLTLKYNKDWYRASEFGTGSGLIELMGGHFYFSGDFMLNYFVLQDIFGAVEPSAALIL